MTQPVDPSLVAAMNARYQAGRQPAAAPAAAPAPDMGGGGPTLDDGSVPVMSSSGVVGSIPASQVDTALRSGYRLVSPEAHTEAGLIADAGRGAWNQVQATYEGSFRGLSGGLSDWAYAQFHTPEEVAEVRRRKQANPYLSGGAELGTGILGAVFTGGSSVGARAGAAAGARFGGATFLSRAGARLVPALVEGAVDGAMQGAGAAVSEAALNNRDLDAERLAMAMGVGGLLGAGIGGGMSLPGVARGELTNLVNRGSFASGVGSIAERESAAKVAAGDAAGGALDRVVAQLDALAAEHAPWLRQKAEELAHRGTGGLLKAEQSYQRLRKTNPLAADRADDMLLRELPEIAKGESGVAAGVSRQDALKALEETLEPRIMKRHGDVIERLDEAVPDRLDVSEAVARIRAAANEKFGNATQQAQKRELLKVANDIEKIHGVVGVDKAGARIVEVPPALSFKQINKMRQDFDQKINWRKTGGGERLGQMEAANKELRDIFESSFEKHADDVSGRIGADLADQWKQAKLDVAAVITNRKALERGVQGDMANQTLGAKELWGAMAGSAALGPLGGLGVAGAMRALKMRGDQAGAAIAARLAKGESVRTVVDGVQRAFRSEIADIASKFPGAGRIRQALGEVAGAGEGVAKNVSLQDAVDRAKGMWTGAKNATVAAGKAAEVAGRGTLAYGEREAARWALLRAKVEDAKNDPKQLGATNFTGSTHPDLQQSLDAHSARVTAVLDKVLPQTQDAHFDIRGTRPRQAPPTAAQKTAARTMAVIDNPAEIVRRVQTGDIRPGDVQAVADVYPQQYARMQQDLLDEFYGRDIPAAARRRLSMVLGGPTDQTMTAPYLAAMAAGSAEWGSLSEQEAKKNGRSAPVRGDSEFGMTKAQKIGLGRA